MKISGPYEAAGLEVSGGRPKTTYIVRFQDTGSGRMTVCDLTTDAFGGGTMSAPIRWGLNNYKVSAQAVGESESVQFTNQPGVDDHTAVSVNDVAPAPAAFYGGTLTPPDDTPVHLEGNNV